MATSNDAQNAEPVSLTAHQAAELLQLSEKAMSVLRSQIDLARSALNDDTRRVDPILLTADQAAALLQISPKTLYNHTAPRGNQIPTVNFGKSPRYSRAALEAWIASRYGEWLSIQQNGRPLAGDGRHEVESS